MPKSALSKRCLIADDVRSSRDTVGIWLGECGFDCTLVDNGQAAWESISEHPPDLLVTDLEMPMLSGLQLLDKVRHAADHRISHLPVLIMTSLRDGKTLSIVQEMGGDGLLEKPLEKHSTLSTILELVAGQLHGQQINRSDDEHPSPGLGMISPTLRRLLSAVAKHGDF